MRICHTKQAHSLKFDSGSCWSSLWFNYWVTSKEGRRWSLPSKCCKIDRWMPALGHISNWRKRGECSRPIYHHSLPYSSRSFSSFLVKHSSSDDWVLFLLQMPSTPSCHVRLVLNRNAKKIVVSLGEEEDRNPIIEYRKWQAIHALLTAKDSVFCVLCEEFGES